MHQLTCEVLQKIVVVFASGRWHNLLVVVFPNRPAGEAPITPQTM
jgi:hypothetical protein